MTHKRQVRMQQKKDLAWCRQANNTRKTELFRALDNDRNDCRREIAILVGGEHGDNLRGIREIFFEAERAIRVQRERFTAHLQMGIGDGLIPDTLNQTIYSEICIVSDEEALQTSRDLARKEGILCGISSGTNVAAAIKLAKKLGKGKRVITVLPDTAERYFSTPLFDGE